MVADFWQDLRYGDANAGEEFRLLVDCIYYADGGHRREYSCF